MTTAPQGSAPDFLTPDELAQEADASEWETVSEEEHDETKVTFDNWGDQFIGDYIGSRQVENENGKFTQFTFKDGELYYFINGNWALTRAMANVPKGSRCRITYVSDKDTGKETPMMLYRVDVPRKRRTAQVSTGRPTRQNRRLTPS